MDLTWYGHSTWLVEVDDTSLLVDPNFDNPFCDVHPAAIDNPDFLLLTHGHADHVRDVRHFAESTVVATPSVAKYVADEHGADNSLLDFGMNVGGTVRAGDAYVSMHAAAHTNELGTDHGDRGYRLSGGPPVSFTIGDRHPDARATQSSETFFHAGDTGLITEFRDVVAPLYRPNVAALPIGGTFTMGPREASTAAEWIGANHVVPMHYDTSPPIQQDPEVFVQYIADADIDAEVHILDGGGTLHI